MFYTIGAALRSENWYENVLRWQDAVVRSLSCLIISFLQVYAPLPIHLTRINSTGYCLLVQHRVASAFPANR